MIYYAIILTALAILFFVLFVFIFIRSGYLGKILVKFGLAEQKNKPNWAVFSWNNTMEKLSYTADIVFFGDSLIRGSDFRERFKDKKIVNLGYSGDTLSGMIERIPMVKAVSPKQVFLLGGINGLTNMNIDRCADKYAQLLDCLSEALPETKIYVHSVLPLSKEKERSICLNESIVKFNQKIEKISRERQIPFIDLYSLYVLDGKMNPELTKDGIHLLPESYDIWGNAIDKYIIEKEAV